MLTCSKVIGAAPGSATDIDWPEVWSNSEERRVVRQTLADMKATLSQNPPDNDPTTLHQFAEPFSIQLYNVVIRVFQQYWRTPSYLYSKTVLCVLVVRYQAPLSDLQI